MFVVVHHQPMGWGVPRAYLIVQPNRPDVPKPAPVVKPIEQPTDDAIEMAPEPAGKKSRPHVKSVKPPPPAETGSGSAAPAPCPYLDRQHGMC